MNIKPSEIESVEDIGLIKGRPVKLLKTLGGFYLAIGSPNGKEEALAAGSHPAIVKYNLKKKFKDFHATMSKSEHKPEDVVVEHTSLLPPEMISKGYDLYSVKKPLSNEYYLTKFNAEQLKITLSKGETFVKAVENLSKEILEQTKEAVKKAIYKDNK
jgi:hypothetical protein